MALPILGLLGVGAEASAGSAVLGGLTSLLGSSSGGQQQQESAGPSDPVDSVSLSPQAQDHTFDPCAAEQSQPQ